MAPYVIPLEPEPVLLGCGGDVLAGSGDDSSAPLVMASRYLSTISQYH